MKTLLIGVAVVALLALGLVAYAQTTGSPMGHAWAWCTTDGPDQHTMGHGPMMGMGHMMGMGYGGMHHNFRGMHRWQGADGHGPGWCWDQQTDSADAAG